MGVLAEKMAVMDGKQTAMLGWISKVASNQEVGERSAEPASTKQVFQAIKPFLNNHIKGAH